MNPTSTLRLRRFTAQLSVGWATLAILLSVAALHVPEDALHHPFADARLGGDAVVLWATPEAAAAGMEKGDRILSVAGEPYAWVAQHSRQALRKGVPTSYRVEKSDGRQVTVRVPPAPATEMRTPLTLAIHVLLLLVAVIYMAAGGWVWWLRPGKEGAWALLLFCSAMATQLATTMNTDMIILSSKRLLVNIPLLGATAFHLFTTYPIEPGWVVRHRRAQLVPYAAAFLLAAAGLLAEPLGLPPGLPWAASFVFTMSLFTASLVVLGVERRRHGDGPMKDAADVVFLSALVSFLPVVALLVAEWFVGTPLPYFWALLWVFVFPVAVGYGIVQRQIFDVRNLAKSSATYAFASLTITAVFVAVGITVADWLAARFGTGARPTQFALLFVAFLIFNPVRSRVQALVDRFFDRDRAAYRVAVREISEAMVSMLSLNEIADRILVALTDTMGVERAMVLLADEDARMLKPIASRGDWDADALAIDVPSDHPIWKHLWMRREDLARVDFDEEHDVENREACRDIFDTLEVELLVPILYGVDLLGVIAVSRKLSGDRLVPDDRLLLRTLANQSSIAIENAKAFDEIAKLNETLEARVEERTAELRETQAQLTQAEKMKSLGQLVAGVAHELNNPIGFVHANLQLLDEYIHKLVEAQHTESDTQRVQDAITRLLERSREGTQRVKKIVQDLRTFSRMDQAELQEADLHEEIGRTLRLMEPRFKDNISVDLDFGRIPRVRCYVGQLNQVFLNLLMNACDAIGRDGTVRIRTRPTENGVRLEFADDGPGIPEDVRSRIFDPFFTTKPVGVGTGLGLSLSHGIIERHNGRFWVESEPGQGAVFFIELPLDATPPEDEK